MYENLRTVLIIIVLSLFLIFGYVQRENLMELHIVRTEKTNNPCFPVSGKLFNKKNYIKYKNNWENLKRKGFRFSCFEIVRFSNSSGFINKYICHVTRNFLFLIIYWMRPNKIFVQNFERFFYLFEDFKRRSVFLKNVLYPYKININSRECNFPQNFLSCFMYL